MLTLADAATLVLTLPLSDIETMPLGVGATVPVMPPEAETEDAEEVEAQIVVDTQALAVE